jgi:hypothetical protein
MIYYTIGKKSNLQVNFFTRDLIYSIFLWCQHFCIISTASWESLSILLH